MKADRSLVLVKLLHTLIWTFFVACIVAIPISSLLAYHRLAGVFIALVSLEVLVLAANRGSCPLTTLAARYTEDRSANFDIYLPVWLAARNKFIFGTLFIAGSCFAVYAWYTDPGGSRLLAPG